MNTCLITVNYNNWTETKRFVESVRSCTSIDKIVVVDNMSTDDSYERLLCLSNERVDVIQSNRNGGYGYGNNCGIRHAAKYSPEYVLISNPDVEFSDKVVKSMKSVMDNKTKIAVIAPVMRCSDGTISECAAWNVPIGKWLFFAYDLPILNKMFKRFYYDARKNRDKHDILYADAVPGSFLMLRMDFVEQFGIYDEKMFLYYEESVLGIKVKKKGLKTCLLLRCSFTHNHATTIKKTFGSGYKRSRIIWKSKRYVFERYYGASKFDLMLFDILKVPFIVIQSVRGFS